MTPLRAVSILFLVVAFPRPSFSGLPQLSDFLGGRPLTPERAVRDILAYYQQPNPMGVPVLVVPDPMFIDANITVSIIVLSDLEITGQSQFRIEYINVNITDMKVVAKVRIPLLVLNAVYNYGYQGNFTASLKELEFVCSGQVGSSRQTGMLEIEDLKLSVNYEEFEPVLTNMGWDLSLGVSALPYALSALINNRLSTVAYDRKEKLTSKLQARFEDKSFLTCPNTCSFPADMRPIDLLVAGVKDDLRRKFDPFFVGNKTVNLPAGATLVASNVRVSGLSTVHRAGEVSLQMIDDRFLLVVQVGTQRLIVSTDVELSAPVLPSFISSLEFSIDSVNIWLEAQQSADVRHPPVLRRLQITLGNFRLLSSGDSAFSYLLEAAVNGLPNALRGVLLGKLQPLLEQVIQRRLDTIDIEAIIEKRLQRRQEQQVQVAAANN